MVICEKVMRLNRCRRIRNVAPFNYSLFCDTVDKIARLPKRNTHKIQFCGRETIRVSTYFISVNAPCFETDFCYLNTILN